MSRPATTVSEAHMQCLINARYRKASQAGVPRYVIAHQVPMCAPGGVHIIDTLVLDGQRSNEVNKSFWSLSPQGRASGSAPAPVHGFEIKVSRSDWLREYRTAGTKSAPWRTYCNYFWLVVPDTRIVKPEELPEGWGLLVGDQQLRCKVKATYTLAESIPQELFTTIARVSHKSGRHHHE